MKNFDESNSLCLECGLCCNGVIFADGQLQPEDDMERLKALGLALVSNHKFRQPCAAFDGCRCKIYSARPRYCREFECRLLQAVKAGRTETTLALRTIRSARQRAEKVKSLLRQLGENNEQLALSKRFRRLKTRFENKTPDEEAAGLYGQLTLAVHDLNLLLSEAFYPETGG